MAGRLGTRWVLPAILALATGLTACGQPGGKTLDFSLADGMTGGESAETVELTVSAAASLTDALKDIRKVYESRHPDVRLVFNFGASGTLQRQIEQGAPVDLFISASARNVRDLVEKGRMDERRPIRLLTNELVVVVPADGHADAATLADLLKPEIKRVAIGIPESVPAGSYARDALANAGLWEALQPKTVQGKDVRQVLQYVESGNADAGFVYRTDALTSRRVRIVFAVDRESCAPVEYLAGIVKDARHRKEAEAFLAFLQSEEALDLFATYGYSVPK